MAVSFCIFIIDGPHLLSKYPKRGSGAMRRYYNFENNCSIILLALIDSRYHFILVNVGAHGNTDSSTDFQSTDIWNRTETGLLIPDKVQVINDLVTRPKLLGDGAFPLRTWITKSYRDAVLSE